jgi:RNA polymerase sigma-70 factor (ECF subfamily)
MMGSIALQTSRPLRLAREARLRSAVDAHYDVVWRFLRRMGVPEGVAEDAVQQVLLVFARKLDDVDIDAERSFLLGTALRVASDVRKQHSRLREVSDECALGGQPSGAVEADVELDRRRARKVLDDLLEQLPPDLRSVFVMCDLEELTMSEVAASLAIPPGTVASRLRRAREVFGELAAEARRRLGEAKVVAGEGGAR